MSHQDTLLINPERIESDNKPLIYSTKPRLKLPVRNQVEILVGCLDDYLPGDHKVRIVWRFVEELDLSQILGKIKSVESNPGAPAIDPKILMAIWLYSFIEGIISARVINRYCREHIAFKWLCGGVSVNEHSISDFRSNHGEAFDDLLTQSIGILSHQGMIKIETIAQDGMKVEAHAGKSSFRREKTLKEHLKFARDHIESLKKELIENPNGVSKRKESAKKRVAEEAVKKTSHAIEELKKLRAKKVSAAKKAGKPLSQKDKDDVRASKTDPEARIMKMPNSGFAPAYNVQFATETKEKIIVGVTVTQAGHDYGQLGPMQEQIRERLGYSPLNVLTDPGFLEHKDVEKVSKISKVYIPSDTINFGKSSILDEIKKRMDTEESKEVYKERAATAEFVNARVRVRGLTQLLVAGLCKVQVIVTLFAIGNNMLVWMSRQ